MYKRFLQVDDFLEDSKQFLEEYTCPLCKGILFDARVDQCGHVFCSRCIEQYLTENDKCPVSEKPSSILTIFPIHFINNEFYIIFRDQYSVFYIRFVFFNIQCYFISSGSNKKKIDQFIGVFFCANVELIGK